MKYSEFISVNENFNPTFDLENEISDNWASFIPNNKFREVLNSVIDSLNPQIQKNPVWLQGTYGTGKSHATSVIKHLLCDEEIPEHFDLEDKQLTSKLNTFRTNNNIFPIVIKGTSTIGSSEKFRATVQIAVKKALREKDMRITVPSDFEHMVDLCEKGILDVIPDENYENSSLSAFPKKEIIDRLKDEESEILIELENLLSIVGITSFEQQNIVQWLKEVQSELKKEYGINYLMIFWDEFTGALSLVKSQDILLEIQNIAEEKNNGLSLFIVSHKTRSSIADINDEKLNKIMDRFERINYSMEPKTTYELMAKSIKKIDEEKWTTAKNRRVKKITPLISHIASDDNQNVVTALENLYPLHPYTAYLATFLAQTIGSTERSIFKFLHDGSNHGFKKFINDFEINQRYYLTAEYLWDFFIEDFENREDEKILSAVKRYNLFFDELNKLDEEYLVVFKVVLLLNILYKIAEVGKGSLAIPSRNNINKVFIGSIYEDKVDNVLNYIESNNIVNETPGHIFELTTNALPAEEVSNTVDTIKKDYSLKDFLDRNKQELIKNNIEGTLIRKAEIHILGGDISQENILISRLEKGIFTKNGCLPILFFICKTSDELINIENIIQSVQNKGFLKNIITIVSESVLSEKDLNNYYLFKARQIVAEKHKYKEDVEINKANADKRIGKWVQKINTGIISWYLTTEFENERGQIQLKHRNGHAELRSFTIDTLNKEISKEIFSYGMENIKSTHDNKNLWKEQSVKTLPEKFISAKNLIDLNVQVSGADEKSVNILKNDNNEWIVDDNLNLIDNISKNHPIKKLKDFVNTRLNQQNGLFNIGDVLFDLTLPPYGLYSCKINTAALSFVLRDISNLYINGNSLNETKKKDLIINIFDYWKNGKKGEKLEVRLGSVEERELGNMIKDIFNLDFDTENQSIDNTKWKLREWIKSNKSPLWLYKYSNTANNKEVLLDAIKKLSNFLKPPADSSEEEVIIECYESLYRCKYDFNLMVQENTESLYEKYLLGLTDKISKEEIPDALNILFEGMQEEIYDWDENVVANKIYEWILRPIDIEGFKLKLKEILIKLFNLTSTNETSFDEIISDINKWINNNKSPLWLFKYSELVEDEKELINSINKLSELLSGGYKNEDSLEKSLDILSEDEGKLDILLKEDSDKLLNKYILSLDKVSKDNLPNIKQALFKNLSDQIYSWNENKVESEVYKWIIDQEKINKIEQQKKLGELINDIFNLNLDLFSLNSVKNSIKDWINKNNAPLWLLKNSDAVVNEKELINAINSLIELIKQKEHSLEFINKCYEDLDSVKNKLNSLLKEDYNGLFEKYIQSLNNEITSKDIPDILKKITGAMGEEISSWDEKEVENQVYKWILQRNTIEDHKEVIDKVKKIPSEELKEITIKILEEHSNIQRIFSNYLEE